MSNFQTLTPECALRVVLDDAAAIRVQGDGFVFIDTYARADDEGHAIQSYERRMCILVSENVLRAVLLRLETKE